jgi:hypothetical protein
MPLVFRWNALHTGVPVCSGQKPHRKTPKIEIRLILGESDLGREKFMGVPIEAGSKIRPATD